MKTINRTSFTSEFSNWTNDNSKSGTYDWTTQLKTLNDITDLITPDLSLGDIIEAIYENLNKMLDAYQFCIGIYDEEEGLLHYKGMIEDGKKFPDFSVKVIDEARLASWCIRHEEDIFINDLDKEYKRYLKRKPVALTGSEPQAALYTPLKLHDKIVGLVVVRTIHKNIYQPYHLHLLKTVGNFVIRALEIAKISSKQYVKTEGTNKQWRWSDIDQLSKKSASALAAMSEREKQVLFLLATGLPNKLIAEKLFISPGTIKTHTLNIYSKLEVHNRTTAVLKAVDLGWFS